MKNKEKVAPPVEIPDFYTISDLDQLKVLADPLRVKILEQLCLGEATTKQVAERLGEKPTRLYHHVDALERVGLIRLTRTRQNRGTVEKYFAAVARAYRTDPGLFEGSSGRDEAGESALQIASNILDTTSRELRELILSGQVQNVQEEGILSFAEIYGTDDELKSIQKRLMAVLEEFMVGAKSSPAQGDRRFRLTLALFPLDRTAADSDMDSSE